jgi:hypothetical protein
MLKANPLCKMEWVLYMAEQSRAEVQSPACLCIKLMYPAAGWPCPVGGAGGATAGGGVGGPRCCCPQPHLAVRGAWPVPGPGGQLQCCVQLPAHQPAGGGPLGREGGQEARVLLQAFSRLAVVTPGMLHVVCLRWAGMSQNTRCMSPHLRRQVVVCTTSCPSADSVGSC